MTKYKCGHKSTTIILDDNELSLSAYLEWKDTVGWNGDKSLCWNCWCSQSYDNKEEYNVTFCGDGK